ncbi:MAG: hypothetical protein HKN47_08415 [Pirellulaceae bacterium]|nr:hypothetical protein [Pirellulaceae bacterium]
MIVIARNYGQLGNRLFLYAHLIAAAQEYQCTLANPCFGEYAHLFPATANDLWCRYPIVDSNATPPSLRQRRLLSQSVYLGTRALSLLGLKRYPMNILRLREQQTCDLNGPGFKSLAKQSRPLLAQGWLFRSDELVRKHTDAIRDHFSIQQTDQAHVDQTIDRIRQNADVVVGVHIRHGDYATFQGGKFFYPVKQYATWMRQVAEQLGNRRVAFLVCSNAKIAVDDFAGLDVHNGPGHIVQDMYCFANCDWLIGPPSTYTLWAAFYGNVPLHVMQSTEQTVDLQSAKANSASHAA